MTIKKLYANVTNTSGIKSVSINESHDNSSTIATIDASTTTLTLGDAVVIDMGYTDNHQTLFTGYVKQIERPNPTGDYSITCNDVLVRAMEYFIVSENPNSPLSYSNITAEELVRQLLLLAGLSSYTYDTTFFTFGVANPFEINLVMAYDYIKTICDLLTWSVWADSSGQVHFENRKPYPMVNVAPENAQPGWAADAPTGFTMTDGISIEMGITTSEKNLRNKIVVYGSGGISAHAERSVSLLPAGFFKTSVLGATDLVTDQTTAQNIADYNLDLFCRYTEQVRVAMIGDPSLRARTVISASASLLGLTGDWYVNTCEHSLSSTGYTTALGLRRMVKAT